MNDPKREILNLVAAGEITPEEGAARLGALEVAPAPAAAPEPERAAAPSASPPRRVKVSTQLGTAEIVGDPSVSHAVADGPHRARQEGDTLVIEHQSIEESDTFTFGHGNDRRIAFSSPAWQRRKLVVRMNPDLELVTDVQAGNVRVDGVHGPITAQVQAGNLTVSDFRGPVDLSVQGGNISAAGHLDQGASRIRCEMGSVKVRLDQSSSVRITARTQMGKVSVDGAGNGQAASADREVTLGTGAGRLDVDCALGSVKVTVA